MLGIVPTPFAQFCKASLGSSAARALRHAEGHHSNTCSKTKFQLTPSKGWSRIPAVAERPQAAALVATPCVAPAGVQPRCLTLWYQLALAEPISGSTVRYEQFLPEQSLISAAIS